MITRGEIHEHIGGKSIRRVSGNHVLRRVTAKSDPGAESTCSGARRVKGRSWEVRAGRQVRAGLSVAGLLQARISSVDFVLRAVGLHLWGLGRGSSVISLMHFKYYFGCCISHKIPSRTELQLPISLICSLKSPCRGIMLSLPSFLFHKTQIN